MPKEKLPKFMLAENPMAGSGDYILHTRYPRFLAKVIDLDNDKLHGFNFEFVEQYDEVPADNPVKLAGLVRRMGDWYIALLNYEKNEAYLDDEEPSED